MQSPQKSPLAFFPRGLRESPDPELKSCYKSCYKNPSYKALSGLLLLGNPLKFSPRTLPWGEGGRRRELAGRDHQEEKRKGEKSLAFCEFLSKGESGVRDHLLRSLVQYTLVEALLCAGHCAGCQGDSEQVDTTLGPQKILVGKDT